MVWVGRGGVGQVAHGTVEIVQEFMVQGVNSSWSGGRGQQFMDQLLPCG